MDRTSWFQLMCHEARATPNYAHKWWNNLFLALPLQDPHTRRPFPSAPPRWAFPGSPDPSPASSMEDTQLHHSAGKKKSKSKTLQPESHEPDYVFLPRIKTESSTHNNHNDDDKKSTKEKSRLHKVPNFRFFGGDKGRLSKDHRPKDPPVTFVADGRMHKAHARTSSGSETPLPPRPNTATGHYEIPRTLSPSPQRQWPDTRGIPGLVRSNRHVGPPPSSFTPSSRRTPTSSSRPRTPVRTEDLLVPLAPDPDAVDISTQFGPGGEAMQAVVDRALLQVQPQPPRRPIQRRHSSAAILTPLVEKTEAEVYVGA
ncbi:hypothetical protein EXIGLDRAFT_341753 [Exidia glandulosa HHB12029]|uniref:DUF7514 domain-containing protein n=1 Tax=Exidia glandulosa HHB12029 TaxID=1314781 RepID=A0A165CHQ6_EXIGL|nr:hypothetical protein EXIGLDRAFT_341753 [Exidia glandulosa HHB12029]